MKLFKDTNNNIYGYELDGSQDYLIPSDYISITDAEAAAIIASKIPLPTYKQLRAAAYPPMVDYLDAIAKSDSDAVKAYIEACLAIKAKYPKS